MNYAMQHKVKKGEAIDLSRFPTTDKGDFILPEVVEGKDYCDAQREEWIWSIGRHKKSGEIHASTSQKLAFDNDYHLLWLR